LQTIDELKAPKVEENPNPTPRSSGKKEENVNETINTGEEIDFNK